MVWRCKLVAKRDLLNKIKKGDVITFMHNSNSSASVTGQQLCEAVANFVGESDWRRVQTFAQRSQYDISFERV